VGRVVRTFFVTGFEHEWRAMNLNAKLLPSAADRDIRPVRADKRFAADVSFIGTGPGIQHGGAGFAPERAEFLVGLAGAVGPGVRVRVWGAGWESYGGYVEWAGRPAFGKNLSRVCSSSHIMLGINPARAAGATYYTSDRIWMMMLGGGFYLGRRSAGLDELLQDGVHCAWYANAAECAARVRYYLAHDGERDRIRKAGEDRVRACHTFDQRIPFLLSGDEWRP
jgi:spore maturation protein CgeB